MTMDAGTKRRLILGLISNWISKLGNSIIQFVQFPFFLHFWPEAQFGEWLIITAIPNYLGFSNAGFGSVAGNEMTMTEARGDREGTLRAFQSCWWLIVLILTVMGGLVALLLLVIPLNRLLNVHTILENDTRWIVAYLGIAVLVGQLEQLLQSAYRCIGRYPFGSFVKSCITLAAFAAMLIPVGLGKGPRATAAVYAGANVLGTVILLLLVKRDIPWLKYGWQHASFAEIRRLAPPAFAYMGFPIGNAFNLQGTLQAVSYALGPVAVVIFGGARTVSRVALQLVQMINSTFEPEFSKSFAEKNSALIRTLHRRACQAALLLALGIVACMIVAGPAFLHHWTQGKVPPSRGLLSILLSVVVLFSLWSTSSTIMTATNQHKRLALVYVCATGVTVVMTFVLARAYSHRGVTAGLYGAAASLLISEALMNLYVVPASLRIAHDTLPDFLRSMFTIPPSLHPQALFRRLRKSRPALES
jgi:O-antigen/teichoic acid export membrane protein